MTVVFGIFACCLALANGASLSRVVGGSDAPSHKYPYQVSFRERFPGHPDFHFCSGSIISEEWILTAAHCFQGRDLADLWAVAGTNYLSEKGESYRILYVIPHEKFETFYYDDIALVRVEAIKFNEFVRPIALSREDLRQYNVPSDFAGWGSTELGAPAPTALQEIKLTVISNEKCLENRIVNENHICTYNSYGHGTCYGDSGGPLVINGIQVGIASYIKACAIGYPDVFTKVSAYIDWIEEKQGKYANVLFQSTNNE